MQLGERLKTEREKLKLTQDEMAERCLTSKRSYCAYEAGETQPKSEFLKCLSDAGVDILYVLTGQRSIGVLEPDEAALVENYRAAPPEKQHMIQEVSSAISQYRDAARVAREKTGND